MFKNFIKLMNYFLYLFRYYINAGRMKFGLPKIQFQMKNTNVSQQNDGISCGAFISMVSFIFLTFLHFQPVINKN